MKCACRLSVGCVAQRDWNISADEQVSGGADSAKFTGPTRADVFLILSVVATDCKVKIISLGSVTYEV